MYKWLEPQTILTWMGLAFIFVSTLVTGMVWLAYLSIKRINAAKLKEAQVQIDHQKKLLETSILVQEEERTRIAADLHDALIGRLAGIRIGMRIPGQLQETDRLLEESIAEARRISHDLSTPLIEHRSLAELVGDMLQPLEERFTISYIHNTYTPHILPVNIKVQAIRIVQELLTNTIRHSEASRLCVHIRHGGALLLLSVNDNGRGFDPRLVKKGLGLNNIELRVQYLQAVYRIKSAGGKGSSTLVAVPLKNHAV